MTTTVVMFIAHVVNLLQLLDAIEVEVVHECARAVGAVFVDDGERGRIDRVGNAQFGAYGFDKGGLARAHLSVEGENAAPVHQLHKFGGRLAYAV